MIADGILLLLYCLGAWKVRTAHSYMIVECVILFIGLATILNVLGFSGVMFHISMACICLRWGFVNAKATGDKSTTNVISGMCLLQVLMAVDYWVFEDMPTAFSNVYPAISIALHITLITIMSFADGFAGSSSHKRPIARFR